MDKDFLEVTEIAGDEVTHEQIQRLCNRYYWACDYCLNKDVLEVACGTGQGLGYLAGVASSVEAGDYFEPILEIARKHYGNRYMALMSYNALKKANYKYPRKVMSFYKHALKHFIQSTKKPKKKKTLVVKAGKINSEKEVTFLD